MTQTPRADVPVLRVGDALRAHGRSRVRWAVASGRWQQPHPRAVVTHNGPLSQLDLLWLALVVAPAGSVLSGPTALRLHGFRGVFDDELTHVTIPHNARSFRLSEVVVHRTITLPAVRVVGSPPRTTVEQSVVDAASWMPNPRLCRAVVLAGLQQRLTTASRVRETLASRGPMPRGALIRESLADAEGGIESLPERDFARVLRRARLPAPSLQVAERVAGRKYRLDAVFEPWGIRVEIDGAHHRDLVQSDADLRRQNELAIGGRPLMRFSSYQVRHEPDTVVGAIRRALLAAGWR